ncbi:NAD(P)-binding domain-containing protein [Aquiflexum sp. LQ15W]|uniref:NADPH-dependent F420 reductase n=1 Tax=Cognataquiflexum nitidum TaxID=2922272 RepID=UPI001F142113|nr:NAD(P)-binding domain-containing protein [Cognataquiflexum nitidum]MCH6200324.1 NAD(P)-binding domain-containing protein [Cognataquiflexum nitidum]
MKIGILGGTKLASTLGNKMLAMNQTVVFGVREDFVTKEIEWKILNMYLDKIFSYDTAIEMSDILLICCENEHLPKVCESLAVSELKNKIIIDCTNGAYTAEFSCNTTLIKKSIGDQKLFKAFNNLGIDYPKSDPMGLVKETYFCGPDSAEKLSVKKIIEWVGFRPVDAGEIENAMLLEAFYHLRKTISFQRPEKMDYHFKLIAV